MQSDRDQLRDIAAAMQRQIELLTNAVDELRNVSDTMPPACSRACRCGDAWLHASMHARRERMTLSGRTCLCTAELRRGC